ncbi:MAG TPA: hypothetical protein VHK27_15330 [Gammaproteobacteria bacterium]|nr:hypothetical protein [Gammaproteobacteria bacterium]
MMEPGEQETTARPIGSIYYGTCGWTDRTLIQSGFYPAKASSAADRLNSTSLDGDGGGVSCEVLCR